MFIPLFVSWITPEAFIVTGSAANAPDAYFPDWEGSQSKPHTSLCSGIL